MKKPFLGHLSHSGDPVKVVFVPTWPILFQLNMHHLWGKGNINFKFYDFCKNGQNLTDSD